MAEQSSRLGTKAKPWKLKTPSGSSEYLTYRDEAGDPPTIVCIGGKTELRYQARAVEACTPC